MNTELNFFNLEMVWLTFFYSWIIQSSVKPYADTLENSLVKKKIYII